ncbi:MAG: hypothetical protein FD144_5313 [Rhodospirillaceae bacterium]|nr:MAG: hypothetical protein FD144_5313 [Rhodospirillaceae bacterium]
MRIAASLVALHPVWLSVLTRPPPGCRYVRDDDVRLTITNLGG